MGDSTPQGNARSIRTAGITLREAIEGLSRIEQHRAAAKWAAENGRAIDLFGNFAKERHLVIFQSGNECENWLDPIDNVLYKMNTLTHVGEDLVRLLDRVDDYNTLFPELALRFVGLQVMSEMTVFPVFAQAFISGARMATKQEIAEYMEALGFEPTGEDGYFSNGSLLLWDIKPKNVLITSTGETAVIDAEINRIG